MDRGTVVEAVGYQYLKDGQPGWPSFLPKGQHRISVVKRTSWGLLVKTDRCPCWLNAEWFRNAD